MSPPPPPRANQADLDDNVLTYLEDVVGRLERLHDRLEAYAEDPPSPSQDRKGPDDTPPSP